MIKRLAFPLRRRLWLAGGAFLLITIAVLLTYKAQSSPAPPEARWLHVQPQVLENQLGLVGRVEAATHTILAAPFEGLVQDLAITDGQRVERDQRLLTLDTTQLDIQIREALAVELKARRTVQDMQNWEQSEEVSRARRALTNARLNLEDTEAKLADTRRLFERGIVARMEVDSLEQQAKTQRLDLVASQAELRAAQGRGQGESRQIAEMELANAQSRHQALLALHGQRELTAPFAGIILPPRSRKTETIHLRFNRACVYSRVLRCSSWPASNGSKQSPISKKPTCINWKKVCLCRLPAMVSTASPCAAISLASGCRAFPARMVAALPTRWLSPSILSRRSSDSVFV